MQEQELYNLVDTVVSRLFVELEASGRHVHVTAQQAQMSELEQKNTELLAEAEALTDSVEALTKENEALTQKTDQMQKKVDFMDSYVVFVEDDGTGLYHKYDCPRFAQRSFLAYSRKLAEKNRYTPCPNCFG